MAGFTAPENKGPFVAPENSGYTAPENTETPGIGDIAMQAGKAALFPLTAPAAPIAAFAEQAATPAPPMRPEDDPEHFVPGVGFPNIGNYPQEGVTSLGPTLDVFSAPFIAKDIASLGIKGIKAGAKALPRMFKSQETKGLEEFISKVPEINKLPAQPELIPPMPSSVAPEMKLEQFKTARKLPDGTVVPGHSSGSMIKELKADRDVAKAAQQIDLQEWAKTAQPGDKRTFGGVEIEFKGVQQGVPEAGIPDFPLIDVRGKLPEGVPQNSTRDLNSALDEGLIPLEDQSEALLSNKQFDMFKSKGVVDKQGNFLAPENALELTEGQGPQARQAFARELPFASDKSGVAPRPVPEPVNPIEFTQKDIKEINKKAGTKLDVPTIPQELPLEDVAKGKPTAPFKMPAAPTHPLPEGAKERISAFIPEQGKDVPAANPFSTSSELATRTGKLEPVVRDQLQAGLKLEVEAENNANKILTTFKKNYGFEPESLESKAISLYGRSPNKALAKQELINAVGPEKAQKMVQAEDEMRRNFQELLERQNVERAANGEPIIPFKENYFPQLHEMNLLNDLGVPKMIGTPEGAELAQRMFTDAETLKNSKFNHLSDIIFKHIKRQGVPDVEDAVTGYQKYVREAERKMALQPHVNELRDTAEAIKDSYPNLAKAYIDRADHIAGKVTSLDASIQDLFGADAMRIFVEATNRMKKNLIQGNPNVPISQTFVLPSITADLPIQDTMSATVKALTNKEFRNFMVQNSPTIQLRLAGREAQSINQGRLAAALSAPSDLVDSTTLLYAMSGKFNQLVREGVPVAEALKQAEQFTSLTQSTLSKLNTAPVLRSKTAQSALPFMNQVLSQARFVGTQLFRNKTVTQKAATAAKFAATGLAIATATQLLLGEKANSPLSPTQYVPMGPALEQGIGGPLLGSAGRILKAKSGEERLMQVFRTAMLLQNKIPAGLQVSKAVEGLFKSGSKGKK